MNKILNCTDDVGNVMYVDREFFMNEFVSVSSESIKEKLYCLNSVCLEKSLIVSPDRQKKLDFETFH